MNIATIVWDVATKEFRWHRYLQVFPSIFFNLGFYGLVSLTNVRFLNVLQCSCMSISHRKYFGSNYNSYWPHMVFLLLSYYILEQFSYCVQSMVYSRCVTNAGVTCRINVCLNFLMTFNDSNRNKGLRRQYFLMQYISMTGYLLGYAVLLFFYSSKMGIRLYDNHPLYLFNFWETFLNMR